MSYLVSGPLRVHVRDGRVVDYDVVCICSPDQLSQAVRELRERVFDSDLLDELL